jgi:cyclase
VANSKEAESGLRAPSGIAGSGSRGSRRHFFGHAAVLGGCALLEASMARAAQVRAESRLYSNRVKLFDLENVAEGVYAALPHPQAVINANAAVFVNQRDVLIVDSHSKPSASAALVAQLRREVTDLPVRYVVNSHFHWDHIQGNSAYRQAFPNLHFVASETTRQLMQFNSSDRMKESLAQIPRQIEEMREQLKRATGDSGRLFYRDQIAQLQAYRKEMEDFTLELPEVTFEDELTIHDNAHTLVLSFLGRAHTAGDIVVYCPEKKVVATGDALIGWLPFMRDSYPKEWPSTLDNIGKLEFGRVIPGHGFVDWDRLSLQGMKAYMEELIELVMRGRERGQTVETLQREIRVESLRSLQNDAYTERVGKALKHFNAWHTTPPNIVDMVRSNVAEIYSRIDAE